MNNYIAMQAAPIERRDRPSLRNALLAVAASFVIAACSGGEQTSNTAAPPGGATNNTPYTGPVARDANVLSFQQEFWANAKTTDRCGSCHNEAVGQLPMFVRNDDINMAYDAALTVTDTQQPTLSRVVEKVGQGHNCWVTDPGVCGTIMTTWIENWVGDSGGGGRQIILTPPPSQDPGVSKNFPLDPSSFETLVHDPILEVYCSNCHSSESANSIQPYFADPDIVTAYDAAKPRINLDTPANSRLVIRLRSEFHNCWSNSCSNDAQVMEDALTAFANGITPTVVDPNLVISKALKLTDGTLASGGNRFEDAQIALWEFKTGSGPIAFDSSGVDPAVDLNLSSEVSWYGGWGITTNGGIARGTTTASKKMYDVIQESGEFSIEAWVVPANVTQEMARIVSYSAGDQARNFTLQQTLYNYDFLLRSTETSLNGDPALSTPDADEVLQATLQHVVATYNPIDGRRIYVNGNLVSQVDPVPGGTLIDWQDTFAFVIGNEVSGDDPWEGTVRLAAVHRRALTQEQITQNFDVGVGEKFFLLFDISETQSYSKMVQTLSASLFEELGQPLSVLGAVLPLEKGPDSDEFFLTFDRLAGSSFNRPDDPTLVVTENNLTPASRIGMKTFDEINATFSATTEVNWVNFQNVDVTYQELRQSLPAVEDVNTFLSSHQVAVAQLAIAYCDALVNSDGNPDPTTPAMFPGFNFDAAPTTAFSVANRSQFVDPLINRIMGTGLVSQPAYADVYSELASVASNGTRPSNLVDRLIAGGSTTRAISKGVCAAMLGNATTLVQ
jgi:hypothetical protein